MVEAFPNTFLGVAVEPATFERMPRLQRGKKFDCLYDAWRAAGTFSAIADSLELPPAVAQHCNDNEQHDERAALVCLLTAASAATGLYVAVGEAGCGYFFLPAWDLWQEWARAGLSARVHDFAEITVWIGAERSDQRTRCRPFLPTDARGRILPDDDLPVVQSRRSAFAALQEE